MALTETTQAGPLKLGDLDAEWVADRPGDPTRRLLRRVRGGILAGAAATGLFFLGFTGWAALAPLDGGSIAPGVISPDGNRKTVQHLEGGIIDTLLVRDGDTVVAGQTLVVLRDVRSRAGLDSVRLQLMAQLAREARLVAEQLGQSSIAFPDIFTAPDRAPEADTIRETEETVFRARQESYRSIEAVLVQRISQLEEEIVGLRAQIASASTQIGLIEEEIEGVSELVEKGLERRPRLLALQRALAQLQGERASDEAAVARVEQTIGETRLRVVSQKAARDDEIAKELSEARSQINTLREQERAAEDVVTRTEVAAPVTGTVVNLRYVTEGGVVAPGSPILDIVPRDDDLLIDARVRPSDIDQISVGQEARVTLSAYDQRFLPQIHGRVVNVTADRLVDQHTGEPYFLARVAVERADLEITDPPLVLMPGMPAEVLIVTGERTLLEYLARPIVLSVRRAFREQ